MEINALLDINIWIDVAIRPGLFPESLAAYKMLTARRAIGLPLCGYTTLHYILSKGMTPTKAREFLIGLEKEPVTFVGFAKEDLALAQQLEIADYEDACVAASAIRSGYNLIITRNPKDFKKLPISISTPKELLSM